jgi:Fic family protein
MLFRPPELEAAESSVLSEIERLRATLTYATGTPTRWFGLLRRNTFAHAIRGSNAIEGFRVTKDDAAAAVDEEEPSIDPKDEAWMAVSGYRASMTFVLQKAGDPFFSYSAEMLKVLHFMMVGYDMSKNPGRWRPGAIFVHDQSTGERVYEGPPSESVHPLVEELIAELSSKDTTSPFVRAAMAHLNLVMIHPFSDGNGRMARCLQTLALASSGITAPLFSSIEEYLGANTRDYYDVLAKTGRGAWHPENDTRAWIRFCLTAHYRQAMTLLRRTRLLQKVFDELEVLVGRLGLPERSIVPLGNAALGYRLRNTTYRSQADVTDAVAGNDLRQLVKMKLLVPHGEKRGRFYLASASVKAIRDKFAEPKSIADPFAEPKAVAPVDAGPFLPGMQNR